MPGRQWLVMKRLWITGSSRFWITGALFRPCNYQPLGMCSIFFPVQWWCFLKSNIFSLHWWSFLNDYAKHDSRQSSMSLISHSTKTGTRQFFCYIRHQMKISQIFTQGVNSGVVQVLIKSCRNHTIPKSSLWGVTACFLVWQISDTRYYLVESCGGWLMPVYITRQFGVRDKEVHVLSIYKVFLI